MIRHTPSVLLQKCGVDSFEAEFRVVSPIKTVMFSTCPSHLDSCMTALVGDGKAYWRAVEADFHRLPWYLFAYARQTKRGLKARVHLESWEQALLEVVEATPYDMRIGVYRVEVSTAGGFQLRSVLKLWRPSAQGYGEGHVAFMAIEDGDPAVPLDGFLNPVNPEWVGPNIFDATA